MAKRAYWKGQLRIALVSIPVEVYSATRSAAKISFHQIHQPSGKRVRYEKVVPGLGPIDREEVIKGYEYEKDSYVLLEQDEIDSVKLESKRTLALTRFVDRHDIDVMYYEKPYYVAPADELANEAFVVLREALESTQKVGLGQLAIRGAEHVVCVAPYGLGMIMETLRYADEIEKPESFFEETKDLKPDRELLELARKLIEEKSAAFEPEQYHDHYVDALKKLIAKKRKAGGKRILEDVEGDAPSGENVIDLMAALKKSVEGGNRKMKKASGKRSKRKTG